GPAYDTVDWAAADADLVVRAKVSHAMHEHRPDGATRYRVTVDVIEAYGGGANLATSRWLDVLTWERTANYATSPPMTWRTPPRGRPSGPRRWYSWAEVGNEVLLFLDRPGRADAPATADELFGCDWVLRRHGGGRGG